MGKEAQIFHKFLRSSLKLCWCQTDSQHYFYHIWEILLLILAFADDKMILDKRLRLLILITLTQF